jgi:RimJ/RimL family protein N-acetyltransferase
MVSLPFPRTGGEDHVTRRASSPLTGSVLLRDAERGDLPILFEHQLEPEATRRADFPARDRASFMAHWNRILEDESVVKKTVIFEDLVAGNVVSFVHAGGREVGYWIGKKYWGRGVATRALAEFLRLEERRPLYANVARHNAASIRVLKDCGFGLSGEEPEGLILELAAGETDHDKAAERSGA